MIWLHIAYNCLRKLEYKYKNIYKDIFINGYKQLDTIKDPKNFLYKIKNFKPYIIKFYKNGTIKPKVYQVDCRNNWQLNIVITYDK